MWPKMLKVLHNHIFATKLREVRLSACRARLPPPAPHPFRWCWELPATLAAPPPLHLLLVGGGLPATGAPPADAVACVHPTHASAVAGLGLPSHVGRGVMRGTRRPLMRSPDQSLLARLITPLATAVRAPGVGWCACGHTHTHTHTHTQHAHYTHTHTTHMHTHDTHYPLNTHTHR